MKKVPSLTDQEIIEGILAGGKQENRALEYLLKLQRKPVKGYVLNNSGNEMDAMDLLQDGILLFHQHVITKRFRMESSVRTYIYGICKYLWLNKLRKKSRTNEKLQPELEIADTIVDENSPDTLILENEWDQLALKMLNQMGDQCKKVLILAYYKDFPMEKIASEMDYKNSQIARNKKFKCIKQLKEIVASDKNWQIIYDQLKAS